MRVPCAAIWTLAALNIWDLNYALSATPMSALAVTSDRLVSLKKVEIIAQSPPAPTNRNDNVQYYQDYQKAVVVPTEDSTQSKPPILNQATTVRAVNQKAANDLVVTATDVQIVGASQELEQIIRKVIQTNSGGETSRSQLQQDVKAILDTGLIADARVDSRSTKSGLSVVYEVEPVVVRSLQLSGAKALTLDVALSSFKPQLGNTISQATINQSVQQIDRWYAQNGYKLARVLSVQPSSDGVLNLEVAEGVVDNVKFRFFNEDGKAINNQGNLIQGRTRPDFLRRELKIKPGLVYREDLVQQDLQQLSQLGIFQSVNIALEGNAKSVDVIYKLTEFPPPGVNVGAGYNQDSGIFGTVSYNDQNVGGINQQLGVNLQASPRNLQFGASFTSAYRPSNPNRFGYQIKAFSDSSISETFDDSINLLNGDQVRERQFGGSITLQRPINDWQTSVGLNYTRTSIRDRDGDISPVDELGNPLSFSGTGIDDLTTVSFTAIKDQRDHPIYPTQGTVLSLSTEQSIPIGLGNISMNRLRASYSQYFPVQLLGKVEVLALNIQGGTTIGDLPPYAAFNLGGVDSVRGYALGDVGSGRSYVLASAEYRFPIFDFIGGAVFADFASDFSSGDTVLGQPAPVRGKAGTGFGYGVGVRLDSAIGIIRAEFGFNDQGDSRLQLGIGQRF